MKSFHLHRVLHIARPLQDIFPFFADPENLKSITPPYLKFRVLSSSTTMIEEGTEIDYALRLHGIPIRWRSRIIDWNPPYNFTDIQIRGPYSKWHHEHHFEEMGGITTATDRVEYAMAGGPLVNKFFVRPDLEKIFDYRSAELTRRFNRATTSKT